MDAELAGDLVLAPAARLEEPNRLALELLAEFPPRHGTSLVWQFPAVSRCPQKTGNPRSATAAATATATATASASASATADGNGHRQEHPRQCHIVDPLSSSLQRRPAFATSS